MVSKVLKYILTCVLIIKYDQVITKYNRLSHTIQYMRDTDHIISHNKYSTV